MAEVIAGPDGRIHMLNEAGAPVTIDPAEYHEAVAAGFRPQTDEEYNTHQMQLERSTLGQQALTAGEGAVRGATLGLGTAALAELGGDEYRQAARERLSVNPGLAVAGEVGGAIIPSLLGGGAGAAARLAEAAPVSIAARAGSAVEHAAGHLLGGFGAGEGAGLAARAAREAVRLGAAGATEGAAYGLGSSLADAALEGTDWTAERALAGAEHGAVYGLTGGAGLGAAGEVAGAAGRKVLDAMLGGKTLRQAVQDFADGRGVKSVVGNDVATFRKLTEGGTKPERIGEAAEWLRERKIPVGGPIEESRDALLAAKKVEGSNMGTVAKELDGSGVRVDAAPILEKVDRRIADLEASGLAGPRALAKQVRRQVEPLREMAATGEGVPFSRVWEDSSFIRAKAKEAGRKASPAQAQLEALYDDMRAGLRGATENASPELAAKWSGAERSYAIASTLYEGAKTEATRQLKNRFISPSDYGTGLSAALASIVTGGGAPAAILTGLATSAAHKLIRERGSAAIGKIADWAANAELGANRVVDRLVGVAEKEGELAGPLVQRVKAAGKFTAKNTVEGRDVSQRSDERSELGRAAVRGGLRLEGHGEQRDEHAETFEQLRDGLLEAQRNPQTLIDHVQRIVEPLAGEQPEVASAMAQKLVGDHQWLAAQLPKPLTQFGKSLAPADAKPLFTRRDQRRLVSYAEALHHTERELAKLGDGKINFDALDALKARRPGIWASMQTRVAMRLAEPGAEIPHRRRVMLSVLFDVPGDPSMAPGTLSAIGRSLAPPPPPAPAPAPSKLNPQDVGRSMATPSQQATA